MITLKQPELIRTAAEELIELPTSSRIKPVIGHLLPLREVAEAHWILVSRGNYCKLVLNS